MIFWNRRWWFWVYRQEPADPNRGYPVHRYDAQYWNGEWWDEGWYVWMRAARAWRKPNYWGGVGCSCDDGYCCRK